MRLKEIKPGMVIHCNDRNEIKAISDAGFVGISGGLITKYMTPECYVIIKKEYADWTLDKNLALRYGNIIEFSDLILPDLTEKEAIEWMSKHLFDEDFKKVFGFDYLMEGALSAMTSEEMIERISKWKSNHEKKDPEVEWVYRVFGTENYGEKFFQTEEEAIKRCEELAKSHKTKQYARYERVCRVKEAE